jgi:hypothetical protein
MASRYYSPSFVVLRFEAVWVVGIAYARWKQKIVESLLRLLRPIAKNAYKPSLTGASGYEAKVVYCTMEEVEPEDAWPAW